MNKFKIFSSFFIYFKWCISINNKVEVDYNIKHANKKNIFIIFPIFDCDTKINKPQYSEKKLMNKYCPVN